MPNILDPAFRYTPSGATDIRKLFARVRKEQRIRQEAEAAAVKAADESVQQEVARKVRVIKKSAQ